MLQLALEQYRTSGDVRLLHEAFLRLEKNKCRQHACLPPSLAHIAALQDQLASQDAALVEYVVGEQAVFAFCITATAFSLTEIPKNFPLEQWIAEMRRGLTAFHTEPEMAAQYDALAKLYTEAAFHLYEQLLQPLAAHLPQHLILLPDGVLCNIPFEVLLDEKANVPTRWQQHAYLLHRFDIRYGYPALLFCESRPSRQLPAPGTAFVGFAPAAALLAGRPSPAPDEMRETHQPLPHSGEEVRGIARLMQGQVQLGTEATRTAFLEKAGSAQILHLACHSRANSQAGDSCFIVFAPPAPGQAPERLFARDISALRLQTALVTLSGCETGIGEWRPEEGCMSLARAFATAGAKSVVTSLWRVSDAKTKDLMLDFYAGLAQGLPQTEALCNAKRNALRNNKGQWAHPFYWAGFVLNVN
ncbi:MAG: CHAT domain-containing protein [Saprospiraceae bacterium]|nr:CHAT domain-containing protein [Saprospiraceae bacterium]